MPGNFFDDPAPATAPAPAQAVPTAGPPVSQPAVPPQRDPALANNFFGDEDDAQKPAPPPPTPPGPKPHEWAFLKGAGGQSNRALELLQYASAEPALALDKWHSVLSGVQHTELQDAWFKNTIEPSQQRAADFDLGPDATFADKAMHGIGATLMAIDQAIASGGEAGAATTAVLGGGMAARAAGGAVTMQAPAAASAVETGQRVLEATGDKRAASIAGATSYLLNAASGAVPMGVGGNLATRVATAGAAGVGMQEVGRVAQNAAMPADMQQPFDAKEDALAALTSAPFGLLGHSAPSRAVVEAPHSIMEHAQEVAASAVRAEGGDGLSQVVAAAQVNAEVGAHHDAAAVQGAREAEQAANMREFQRQAAEQADADAQTQIEQGQREQGLNQAEAVKAPETTPEQGFAQKEAEAATQKDKDFTAAKNQVGEQAVEAAKTEATGAEKGGATEPPATIADALPPDQREALQSLKARRAAEMANPEPAPEPTVQERMRQQAKGTEDDFQELPPLKRPPTEAQAPITEEEAPETNPPPATAQTLAQRRQAALDEAMAAKVRGTPEGVPETPENTPQGVEQPNRLAAIRAAAEKRAGLSSESAENPKRPPLRQDYDPAEKLVQEQAARDAEAAAAGKPGSFAERRAMSNRERGDITNDLDRLVNPRMSHDEAKEHLSGVSDQLGPRSFQVHESQTADTIPPKLKAQIEAHMAINPDARVKGAYLDGVAHVFADSHYKGDKEEVLNTAVHELAHKGVAGLLGDQHANVMGSLGQDIKNTAWAKAYVARRGWDLSNPRHVAALGDEYAAHMAENVTAGRAVHEGLPVTDNAPSHWQKVVDAVRAALRKVGIVKHWNDNDVAALIRQAQSYAGGDPSRMARDGQAYKDSGGARFSLDNDDKYMEDHFAPDHPLAVSHKFGRTMEEQGKYNPGFIRDPAGFLKDKWDNTLSSRLATIGLRNLPDFLNKRTREHMSAVQQFIRTHDAMEGRRGRLAEVGAKIALDWSKWGSENKRAAGNLGELMHAATIGGVDPSRELEPRYTAEERAGDAAKQTHETMRENLHGRLQDYYKNNLDDKGRELFSKVRDFYQDRRSDVIRGIEARITESGADGKTKQQLMAQLRQKFEQGRVQGPYFPLTRFGDHWARAVGQDGQTVSFSRFESARQKQAWMDEARKAGFDVQGGKKITDKSMMERIDPDFVKKVTELAKDVDPKLADEIWQEYLKAMPEMSMRKHLIHRQGRLGYSADALRGFAYNAFHGSHQIARLEYGARLNGHMDDMQRQQEAAHNNPELTDTDKNYATELTKEFGKRLDWINNPKAGALASAMTKFGFGWYLGFAPATAFRILSQNPMLAQPVLAKFHGQLGASRELLRASGQFIRSKGQDGLIDSLRGNERIAMDNAKDQGMFSTTWAQTLASGGEGAPMTGKMMAYNRAAAYLFNAAEHHNRATTYLAAYRLGTKQGMSHTEAMEHAGDLTWSSHFDYTNANRPRFMQNDFVKVAGLFKQYSLGVTYRLAREFRNMTRMDGGVTPEERKQSTAAFASLLGRSALFSGVTGLPLYWVASTAMNYALGDKDNPVDSTALIHKQLNDTLGQTAGDSIMTGPMGALSGASLSTGASYNDLWYKPPGPDMSAADTAKDALDQLGGAIPAIGLNAAQGASQIAHGNTERGLEHFLPPALAGPVKAVRMAQQGATNMKGEPIMRPEDMADRDKYLQAFGFTPQDVADQYQVNNARKNNVKELDARRMNLKGAYAAAISSGTDSDVQEAAQDIANYNAKNPDYAIGADEAKYIMAQAKAAALSINGVTLPSGLRGRLQEKY